MPVLYNTALNIGQGLLRAVGRRNNQKPDDAGKLRKFIDGHAGLMQHIASTMDADRRDLPTYWFHAASLGESCHKASARTGTVPYRADIFLIDRI